MKQDDQDDQIVDPDPRRAPGRCDVLVAEDDPDNAMLTALVLRQAGFSTRIAQTGPQTLELAQELRPRVILMDWWMPEIDGMECTRRLKGALGLPETVVLAVTAGCMPGDRERVLAAGCDGYFSKPVELPELLAEIRKRLRATLRDPGHIPAVSPAATDRTSS